jgi:hypothetical protein
MRRTVGPRYLRMSFNSCLVHRLFFRCRAPSTLKAPWNHAHTFIRHACIIVTRQSVRIVLTSHGITQFHLLSTCRLRVSPAVSHVAGMRAERPEHLHWVTNGCYPTMAQVCKIPWYNVKLSYHLLPRRYRENGVHRYARAMHVRDLRCEFALAHRHERDSSRFSQ